MVICVYSFWGFIGHTENSYSAVGVLAMKMLCYRNLEITASCVVDHLVSEE